MIVQREGNGTVARRPDRRKHRIRRIVQTDKPRFRVARRPKLFVGTRNHGERLLRASRRVNAQRDRAAADDDMAQQIVAAGRRSTVKNEGCRAAGRGDLRQHAFRGGAAAYRDCQVNGLAGAVLPIVLRTDAAASVRFFVLLVPVLHKRGRRINELAVGKSVRLALDADQVAVIDLEIAVSQGEELCHRVQRQKGDVAAHDGFAAEQRIRVVVVIRRPFCRVKDKHFTLPVERDELLLAVVGAVNAKLLVGASVIDRGVRNVKHSVRPERHGLVVQIADRIVDRGEINDRRRPSDRRQDRAEHQHGKQQAQKSLSPFHGGAPFRQKYRNQNIP